MEGSEAYTVLPLLHLVYYKAASYHTVSKSVGFQYLIFSEASTSHSGPGSGTLGVQKMVFSDTIRSRLYRDSSIGFGKQGHLITLLPLIQKLVV